MEGRAIVCVVNVFSRVLISFGRFKELLELRCSGKLAKWGRVAKNCPTANERQL